VILGDTPAAQAEREHFRQLAEQSQDRAARERLLDALAERRNDVAYSILRKAGLAQTVADGAALTALS
jgi:hypothetical protein